MLEVVVARREVPDLDGAGGRQVDGVVGAKTLECHDPDAAFPGLEREEAVDNPAVYIVLVVLVLVAAVAARLVQANRRMDSSLSDWCRKYGVPDVQFDYEAAAREVVAGIRPGIPRDGRWWAATGIEQIGNRSRTRLLDEGDFPDDDAINEVIVALIEQHSGAAILPPHQGESRFIGRMTKIHPDIVFVRITGRHRPIGAWLVAVPPAVIASKA